MIKDTQTFKAWIERIFNAKQAKTNGIIRRSIKAVNTIASEDELKQAVKLRNFHLVKTKEQYVILCNTGDMKLLT
jgi:hypothetical protein